MTLCIQVCHDSPTLASSAVQFLPLGTEYPVPADDFPVSVVDSPKPLVWSSSLPAQFDHSFEEALVLLTAFLAPLTAPHVAVLQCAGSW